MGRDITVMSVGDVPWDGTSLLPLLGVWIVCDLFEANWGLLASSGTNLTILLSKNVSV